MAILGNLVTVFSADMTDLKAGIAEYGTELKKAEQSSKLTGAEFAALAGITTAAGAASYAAVQKYGAMANELEDLSMVTGMSTEQLQRMQYTAMLSGNTFASITPGLNRLTLSISEFRDKSSAASAAFQRLGIDPTGKSTAQVFDETARALMGMKDETERNALAMDLYGRNYKDIIPFMDTYIQRSKEIKNVSVFSADELRRFKEAKTDWDKITDSVTKFTGKVIVAGLNVQDLLNKFNPLSRLLGGSTGEVQKEESISTAPDLFKESAIETDSYTSSVGSLTDAMRAYKDAVAAAADEQERLDDIEKNFGRQASITNARDISAVRNLVTRHQWDVEDQQERLVKSQTGVAAGAAAVGTQMASFSLNIQTANFAKDYPVDQMIRDYEDYFNKKGIQQGV